MANIDNNEIKYEWDDECDCNTIIYDSLIERLEEQLEHNGGFGNEDAKDALKCIKWQKEEHDRLLQKLQQVKSEIIKEFAERLKAKALTTIRCGQLGNIDCYDIDNLVKETINKRRIIK